MDTKVMVVSAIISTNVGQRHTTVTSFLTVLMANLALIVHVKPVSTTHPLPMASMLEETVLILTNAPIPPSMIVALITLNASTSLAVSTAHVQMVTKVMARFVTILTNVHPLISHMTVTTMPHALTTMDPSTALVR